MPSGIDATGYDANDLRDSDAMSQEKRAAECKERLTQSMIDALAIVSELPTEEQDRVAAAMLATMQAIKHSSGFSDLP